MWDTITAGIHDGVPSKETALQAFAFVFGVRIQGVKVPDGAAKGMVPTSGTMVRDWVESYRSELTPSQLAVIDGTRPKTHAVALTISATDGITVARNVAAGSVGRTRLTATVTKDLVDLVGTTATQMVPDIGQRLGVAVLPNGFPDLSNVKTPTPIEFNKVAITFENGDGGEALMETFRTHDESGTHACEISLYRAAWTPENSSPAILSTAFRVELAHELVHCYQNLVWPAGKGAKIPWISEGSATWAATDYLQSPESLTAMAWRDLWVKGSRKSLENRTYDAVGFWALAQRAGRNLWPNLMAIWATGTTPGALAAVKADNGDLQQVWAPTYVRRADWGSTWTLTGVGLPDDAQIVMPSVGISKGGEDTDTLSPHAAAVATMSVHDDLLYLKLTGTVPGALGVHDENGTDITGIQGGTFCMIASCICAQGTRRAGQDLAPTKLAQPFVLAASGGGSGSRRDAVAKDLKTACGELEPPGDPTPPCGKPCARSNGDPHLRTVDSQVYDFQAAGEYVLLRDDASGLQIQARQEPYDTSTSVAINTAIVVGVNGHRFQLAIVDHAAVTTVDGEVVRLGATEVRPWAGGTITNSTRGPKLSLADGTVVYLLLDRPDYGVQLELAPGESVRAHGRGLLGVVDALSTHGLPPLADGTTPAGTATRRDAIYRQLGPSWLVDERSALFTYAAGRTTASYRIADFPRDASDGGVASLATSDRERGEAACGALASDPSLHDACVFDVGVTGQSDFAGSYAVVADLETKGDASLSDPPPTSSAVTSHVPTASTAGLVDIAAGIERLAGEAIDGDQLYLATASGDQGRLARYDVRTGKPGPAVALTHAGRVAIAAGSLWVDESDGSTCVLVRRDLSTLAEQARVPVTGCAFGASFARGGDRIWVLGFAPDPKGGASKSALAPIDPATNAVGAPILVPDDGDSYIAGGEYGVVISDSAAYVVRADDVSPTLKPLPGVRSGSAVGRAGVWVEDNGVVLRDGAGRTLAAYADRHGLQAADGESAFVADSDKDGKDVLVELTASQGAPRVAARVPEPTAADTEPLSFFTDSPLLVDHDWIVQLWVFADGRTSTVKALVVARS